MEILVLLLVVVGVLVGAYLLNRPSDYSPCRKSSDTDADNPPRQATSKEPFQPWGKAQGAKAPGPFDPETAHLVAKPRIIEGPAYVTDGDTITIQKTKIRLYGIDAPELDHPYGKKAKWALVRLCKGHTVRAEITDEDDYGRTVAKCFLPDGRDLSAELVTQGLAIDWPKFSGGKYSHLEVAGVRKKLWLADARQKGMMHVWEKYEARQKGR